MQEFFKTLRAVSVAIVAAFVFGTFAQAWTGPTALPPNNNAPMPINVSAASQTINGNLYIGTGFGFSSPTICIGADCRSAWPVVASQWVTSGADVYYNSGNVGIGTVSPGQKLTVAGIIQSTSGGIRFPDGTTQLTAAGAGGSPSSWTCTVRVGGSSVLCTGSEKAITGGCSTGSGSAAGYPHTSGQGWICPGGALTAFVNCCQ